MLEALLFNKTAGRPGDSWSQLPDRPFARHSAGVTSIDSEVYIFGGQDKAANTVVTNTLYRYNIETAETVLLNSGPTARTAATLTAIDGKLYMAGGSSNYGKSAHVKDVWCYTPETDSWVRKADMPVPRSQHAAVAIGTKLYITAGKNSDNSTNRRTTLIYDTLTDTWTTGAVIPVNERIGHTMAVINDYLYVHGGFTSGNLRDLLRYDTLSDSWVTLATNTQARVNHVTGVVKGKMYILMGDSQSGNYPHMYDPVTDTWTKQGLAMLSNNQYAGSIVYKDEIYTFGGTATNAGSSIYRYTP